MLKKILKNRQVNYILS